MARVYTAARRYAGHCPIEAGIFASNAEHECHHGRLAGDPSPVCGCWPWERAVVIQLPSTQSTGMAVAA